MTSIKPMTRPVSGMIAAAMLDSGSIAPGAVISVTLVQKIGNLDQPVFEG
jgi:hypothetical protein